jgi:hypothetical protein
MLGRVDDLTTTQGVLALVAAGVALIALVLGVVAVVSIRRLRAAQRIVLGDSELDVVSHAADLQREFSLLQAGMESVKERLEARMAAAETRLDASIAHSGLVRYDAYNELSGRQSTSIALLDANRDGIVFSSIHHRDQARLYAKRIRAGNGDLQLSPEEAEAVQLALTDSADPRDAAGEAPAG